MIFFGKPVPTFPDHAVEQESFWVGHKRRKRRAGGRPAFFRPLVQAACARWAAAWFGPTASTQNCCVRPRSNGPVGAGSHVCSICRTADLSFERLPSAAL